ncbi:MAG TPA: GNAT family N-acetyltransferase, partial [Pseudonocardiaceae bacterium]
MTVVIEELDPAGAPAADVAGAYRVVVASRAVDEPGEPRLERAVFVARLSAVLPDQGRPEHLLARDAGEPVGLVTYRLPERENTTLAVVEVTVRPDRRREGIGTALLEAALPRLRGHGRRVLEGRRVVAGGAGQRWALARGFEPVRSVVVQVLVPRTADRSRWAVEVPAGYRLRDWIGAAPDDLVAAYAEARRAIHDAPVGRTAFVEPDWTVERVRRLEADLRAEGTEQRVVVAVHEDSGAVAGLTEMVVGADRPTWAYQGDTVVVPAHRGRGLGLAVKARMARWLLSERPGLERVQTTTGSDNTHMLRVNEALGLTTHRAFVVVRRDL